MLEIRSKRDCSGCAACMNICPLACINMQEDDEGFLYPYVNEDVCVHCGACEKVCPELHSYERREPERVFAAQNIMQEIRRKSSSGGIFYSLAQQIITQGGIVVAARFDENWEVIHDVAKTIEELPGFLGSKYVQSRIGNSYAKVASFLREGHKVLFVGTPCQVTGLKHYLKKDYDNLLTVDVICHGVPSPKVWRMYLQETFRKQNISKIDFREKSHGWKNFSFCVEQKSSVGAVTKSVEVFHENPYMKVFLANLDLRPSCYACKAKDGCSGSDLTIGDYWGIDTVMPDFDDDAGTSAVLVYNREKVIPYLLNKDLVLRVSEMGKVIRCNNCLVKSVPEPANRAFFFSQLKKASNLKRVCLLVGSPKWFFRLRRFIYRTLGI